jgi:hypothetical protein
MEFRGNSKDVSEIKKYIRKHNPSLLENGENEIAVNTDESIDVIQVIGMVDGRFMQLASGMDVVKSFVKTGVFDYTPRRKCPYRSIFTKCRGKKCPHIHIGPDYLDCGIVIDRAWAEQQLGLTNGINNMVSQALNPTGLQPHDDIAGRDTTTK